MKKPRHSNRHLKVKRPWGYYIILYKKEGYKVKEIGVMPKKALSLQRHRYRSEHWNVVKGKIQIIIDGKEKVARTNESVFVPKNTKHKVYNPTNTIAKIIEVQIGKYVGEDDITRFDSYK